MSLYKITGMNEDGTTYSSQENIHTSTALEAAEQYAKKNPDVATIHIWVKVAKYSATTTTTLQIERME